VSVLSQMAFLVTLKIEGQYADLKKVPMTSRVHSRSRRKIPGSHILFEALSELIPGDVAIGPEETSSHRASFISQMIQEDL